MKKLIATMLILVLVFALCACGETTVIETEKKVEVEVPVMPEEYIRYQSLLDMLEAGNYDDARAAVEKMKPEPEMPPVVKVDITKENFFDYFEYVEIPEFGLRVERYSSGEPAAIFARSGFYLKEGYTLHPELIGDSKVNIKMALSYWYLGNEALNINFDDLTYTLNYKPSGKNSDYNEKEVAIESIYADPYLYFPFSNSTALLNDFVNYIPTIIDKHEVLSAAGTLYLAG